MNKPMCVAVMAFTCAGAAFAGPGQKPMESKAPSFEELDTNDNGSISRSEAKGTGENLLYRRLGQKRRADGERVSRSETETEELTRPAAKCPPVGHLAVLVWDARKQSHNNNHQILTATSCPATPLKQLCVAKPPWSVIDLVPYPAQCRHTERTAGTLIRPGRNDARR